MFEFVPSHTHDVLEYLVQSLIGVSTFLITSLVFLNVWGCVISLGMFLTFAGYGLFMFCSECRVWRGSATLEGFPILWSH